MQPTKLKKYTLRFRAVDRKMWENIKNGRKTVETRAASKKYQDIKAGDILILVCGKDRFEKKVKRAHVFKNIPAMLRVYQMRQIMPQIKSYKEFEAAYYNYPGYREKIKKFGLIAMELE